MRSVLAHSIIMVQLCAFIVTVLAVGLQAQPLTDYTPVVILVDRMISGLNNYTADQKLDKISLPSINETWTVKEDYFSYDGHFMTGKGVLKDISTIKRTHQMRFKKDESSISVGLSLALENTEMYFGDYHASVIVVDERGNMTVYANATIESELTLHFAKNGSCTLTVDDVHVKKVDNIDAQLSHYIPNLYWIHTQVVGFFNKTYRHTVANLLTAQLRAVVDGALAINNNCNNFP